MSHNGWRTVVTQPHDRLGLHNGCMIIGDEADKRSIPLEQIRELLITSTKGSISLPLLVSLVEHNVAVIFCDHRYSPVGQIIGLDTNTNAAGHLMDQAEWSERKRNAVWRQIVKMKLKNQRALLIRLHREEADRLQICLENVAVGDATNREAVAARIFFNALFGDGFVRFAPDETNAALNYGYTILCSAFSRSIVLHGYSTALGIHHRSRQNRVNLSCDLMEPFRPLVDEAVQRNIGRALDWPYRQELIALMHAQCIFDGRRTDVSSAIDAFVLDVMKAMGKPRYTIKEVSFGG